ncbi:MAG: hypothetical protein GF347_03115 [Candidatus Moranbacteria bacterium]|nr:hypothetical protein [Candidatus Moranbacteria bacterium]
MEALMRKTIVVLFILSTFLMMLFSSCDMSKDTVAKIGDRKITKDEFKANLDRRYPNREKSNVERDSTRKYTMLNRMIDNKLKVNAAYDKNLDEATQVLAAVKARKSQLIGNKYFEKVVVDQLIPESELREYFDRTKEEVKASHILIAYEGATRSRAQRTQDEAKKLAEDLANRAQSGENFAELAQKYSDDPSAKQNQGDLGFFTCGKMVPEFQMAAFQMEKGEISDPVLSSYGYHVIKLEDRRPNENYDPNTFEKQKYTIKRNLYRSVQDSGRILWKEHSEKLKSDKQFEILPDNIKKVNEIAKKKNEEGTLRSIEDFSKQTLDIPLAEWNGGKFFLRDLLMIFQRNFGMIRTKLNTYPDLKQQVENFSMNDLMLQHAEEIGITDDEEIQRQLKQMLERPMI